MAVPSPEYPSTSEKLSVHQLLALKTQYEQAFITAIDTKVAYYKEQITHINTQLLNQPTPAEPTQPSSVQPLTVTQIEPVTSLLALQGQTEPTEAALDLTLDVEDFLESTQKKRRPRTASRSNAVEPAQVPTRRKGGKRSSLTLLPAYQGMSKLEAIKTVLSAKPGQVLTLDTLTQTLYGELSEADYQAERLRMKSALFQGLNKNLWQKADAPSSYVIGSPKSGRRGRGGSRRRTPSSSEELASQAVEASEVLPEMSVARRGRRGSNNTQLTSQTLRKQRNSLPFLSPYAGQKKLDAIGSVLQQHPGEVLHHDTIIQTLYGDLSPEDLKAERIRIKTALLTGVRKGFWNKATQPSRYYLNGDAGSTGLSSSPKAKKTARRGKAKAKVAG